MRDLGQGDEEGTLGDAVPHSGLLVAPLGGRHTCSGDSCIVDVVRIENDAIAFLDAPGAAVASLGFELPETRAAGVSAEERTVFFGLAGTPRRHLVLAILLI